MNTKLLASIAVFALLTSIVGTSFVNSAYAIEDKAAKMDKKMDDKKAKMDKKMDTKKAKVDKKMDDKKAKVDKKMDDKKAKMDKKMDDKKSAAKEAGSGKATGKAASEVVVDIPKGAMSPACADTKSCYTPSEATVSVGGTVTWTNSDSAGHFATSGKDATSDGKFDSGMIMAGGKFSQKFDTAGEYYYFCLVHPWMTGEIIVK